MTNYDSSKQPLIDASSVLRHLIRRGALPLRPRRPGAYHPQQQRWSSTSDSTPTTTAEQVALLREQKEEETTSMTFSGNSSFSYHLDEARRARLERKAAGEASHAYPYMQRAWLDGQGQPPRSFGQHLAEADKVHGRPRWRKADAYEHVWKSVNLTKTRVAEPTADELWQAKNQLAATRREGQFAAIDRQNAQQRQLRRRRGGR